MSVPPRLLWRKLQEAPVSGLELCRKCCHFFVIVPTSFCIQPILLCLNLFLDVKCGGTWWYVPKELHLWGCQLQFSTNPCSFHTSSNFVVQLLDGSGFETPTHNGASENTWTFILINVGAGSLSTTYFLTHEMCSSPARFACCMRLCDRSICLLVVARTVSNLVFLRNVCSSLVSQDEGHKQSLVNWLQIATLSGKSWRLIRNSPNLTHKLLNTWLWNSCSLCALRLEICRIVELADVIFSISIWMNMNFLFTWRIFCSNWSLMLQPLPVDQSLMLLTSCGSLIQNLAGTGFHAWSRLQLDILVEVLRDCPDVGILIDKCSRNQSCAMNWLLLHACRCSDRVSSTFAHARKKESQP